MNARWYHRNLTGVEAEKLLEEHGQDGSFLIRPSQSTSNSYTLSVRCGNQFKHIKIQNNGDCYDIGENGDKFATLAELIEHYIHKETLRDKNDGGILCLKYPLSYQEPTSERYFHGAISGETANKLLIEKGKPGSFLVRESRSDPQNYVLCVRCENNKVVNLVINYTKTGYTMLNHEGVYPTLDKFITVLTKMCPIVDSKDNVVYLRQPLNSSRVNVNNLDNRVRALEMESREKAKAKSGFSEEFEALPQLDGKLLYSRKEGQKIHNVNKNRFKAILPFDHTRVILKGRPEDQDYINANFIKSEDAFGKTYIATQGPLVNTVIDFWHMIWQEGTRVILMVTHEKEKGKEKCYKYWPSTNEQVKYDYLTIKSIATETYEDYLLRVFLVSNGSEERKVFHFQYLEWGDHSVPENVRFTVSFVEHVNKIYKEQNYNTAVTVHCSAGIGRTGAVIVIDMVIDKIKHYGLQCDIDIQKTVLHLRSQRSGMVQTEKQYQFLYKAVNEYLNLIKVQQTNKNKQQNSVYLSLADDTGVSVGNTPNHSNISNAQFDGLVPNFRNSCHVNSNDGITLPTQKSNNKFLVSDSVNNSLISNSGTLPYKNSQIAAVADKPDDGYLVPSDHLLNSNLIPLGNQAMPMVRRAQK